MAIDVSEFMARLTHVLGERKPYPWGAEVGLSRGAIHRMLQGDLPDPARLVPMARIEGLSLTWLLTGQGTPYVLHVPASDAQGADLVEQLADEMSQPAALLVTNRTDPTAAVALLVEHVTKTPADGEPYEYDHAELIGGPRCSTMTATAVARHCRDVRRIALDAPLWRRLASGHMALSELRGIADKTPALVIAPAAVAEEPAEYGTSELEERVITAMRKLPRAARELIARMVEAAA